MPPPGRVPSVDELRSIVPPIPSGSGPLSTINDNNNKNNKNDGDDDDENDWEPFGWWFL